MKDVTLIDRFRYWFDKKIARGGLGLIKLLAAFSFLLVLIISTLIALFHLSEGSTFPEILWDGITSIIGAEMPGSEDGGFLYIALMAIIGIAGLFVTSVLIGIISASIEDKINSLKRGNSTVIESGHTVVLGFVPGEYTLIKQLILAADGKPSTIVVAANMERDELEMDITDNMDIPKNINLICRKADLFSPADLEKCAISTCRSVMISPTDDRTTTKILLALSNIIFYDNNGITNIGAIVSKNEYVFPPSIAERHNITTLQTNDILARMIAHSCTQSGLSMAFNEMFSFEGSEFYLIPMQEAVGYTFIQLMSRIDGGAPTGIQKGSHVILNPSFDTLFEEGDKLLVFAESPSSVSFVPRLDPDPDFDSTLEAPNSIYERVTIIGSNEEIRTVIKELPENVIEIVVADVSESEKAQIIRTASRRENLKVTFYDDDIHEFQNLVDLAKKSRHIALLCNHEKDNETSDMDVMFMILNLRDIRNRYNLTFDLTAEMKREANERLISINDGTDYIVASNMASLLLAQLSESPDLLSVFQELLSNEGNELYLKTPHQFGVNNQITVRELRETASLKRCIFLGYIRETDGVYTSHFNPPLNSRISFTDNDTLIVMSEN